MIENLQWTGVLDAGMALVLRDFTHQGDTFDERVSWWVEPLLFDSELILNISHRPSGHDPVRVAPGQWVHFDGARFGPGQRKGGKDT